MSRRSEPLGFNFRSLVSSPKKAKYSESSLPGNNPSTTLPQRDPLRRSTSIIGGVEGPNVTSRMGAQGSVRRESEENGELPRRNTRRESLRMKSGKSQGSRNELDGSFQLEHKFENLESSLCYVLNVLALHEAFLQRKFHAEFEEYATSLGEAPDGGSLGGEPCNSSEYEDTTESESSATSNAIPTDVNAGTVDSPPSPFVNPVVITSARNMDMLEDYMEIDQSDCNSNYEDISADELAPEDEEKEEISPNESRQAELFNQLTNSYATIDAVTNDTSGEADSEESQSQDSPASPSSVHSISVASNRSIGDCDSLPEYVEILDHSDYSSSGSEEEDSSADQFERKEKEMLAAGFQQPPHIGCNVTFESDENYSVSDGTSVDSSSSESGEEWTGRKFRVTNRRTKIGNKRKLGEVTRNESSARRSELECPICHKISSSKSNLNQHKKRHDPEKKFKCQLCPKAFHCHFGLQRHGLLHRNERPFKCSWCPKTFRESGNLRVHERIHRNVKPYKCSLCSQSFRHTNTLRRHERKDHSSQ